MGIDNAKGDGLKLKDSKGAWYCTLKLDDLQSFHSELINDY